MIREILLRQKIEKEEILKKRFIEREIERKIEQHLNTRLIKVITGLRRSGKSFLGIHLLKNYNFAYVNFDDEKLIEVEDYSEIVKILHEIYGEFAFLFLDEIQNLEKWELFVNRLQRSGYNLIITGSNAKLLSKDLVTHLTGRYVEIENFPFSFREFLKARNIEIRKDDLEVKELKGRMLNWLKEYMKIGGLPEIVVEGYSPENYGKTLFDSIIFKDIVKRYDLRFSSKIYDLARYLISNISTLQSFTKIKESLNFRSVHTVQDYFEYLREAYLIFFLNEFSFSVKKQIRSKKKIYSIDPVFPNFVGFRFSEDFGKLMENLVVIELLREGHKEIYYLLLKDNEVDFVVKEGLNVKQLIQVTYASGKDEIERREINALLKASEELKCKDLLVITWDYEDEIDINRREIKCIPLWKWLLFDK